MNSTLPPPDTCYQALKAHDARFDGRFFVGVATTGIYCRPVCRVRLPRRSNCIFFPSAAAAEAAGFRPCLRCRPELAPGFAASEASSRLARAAARLIEHGDAQPLAQNCGMAVLAARSANATCGACLATNSVSRPSSTRRRTGCCWPSAC